MYIYVPHVTMHGNFKGYHLSTPVSLYFLQFIYNYVVPLTKKIDLKINYICIDINSHYVRFKLF